MNITNMYSTIDTHVAGEAFRIVIQSPIRLHGSDIQANHEALKNNFTNVKNLLLNEPRGHRGINGCVVGPSQTADISLLFFNHEDVSNFKYEGLFATITALIETGNLEESADRLYKVETVNGSYSVKAIVENQEVISVSIESEVCSEINANQDYVSVSVDNSRNYLLYTLPDSIPSIELEHLAALNCWGLEKTMKLKDDNIDYVGVVVVESMPLSTGKIRSVTFEKDGYILRSPGIDSTFAILTSLAKKGVGQSEIENESIFGSSLTAKRVSEEALRFSVETEAFVTGAHEFIFDQDDPLKEGFLLV